MKANRERTLRRRDLVWDKEGTRWLVVRHPVIPGRLAEAEAIVRWRAGEVPQVTYVNTMGQYRPESEVGPIAREGRRRSTRRSEAFTGRR